MKAWDMFEDILFYAKGAFEQVSARRDPERDRVYDMTTKLEDERAGKQATLTDFTTMLSGKVTAAVAAQFAMMSAEIEAIGIKIGAHRATLHELEHQGSELPAQYDALIHDFLYGEGQAKDSAARLLNAALRSVLDSVSIVVDGMRKGHWEMETKGGYAVMDADTRTWFTIDHAAAVLRHAAKRRPEYSDAVERVIAEASHAAGPEGTTIGRRLTRNHLVVVHFEDEPPGEAVRLRE